MNAHSLWVVSGNHEAFCLHSCPSPCLSVRSRFAWLLRCHPVCLKRRTLSLSRFGSCCLPGVQKALAWHIYSSSRIGSSLSLPGAQKALEWHNHHCFVDRAQFVAHDHQRDTSQANCYKYVSTKQLVAAPPHPNGDTRSDWKPQSRRY